MNIEAMKQVRQIFKDYAEPNSFIDSGNLYWALGVALQAIAEAGNQLQRQWVGLTNEEIDRLNFTQVGGCQCSFGYIEGIEEFAKSIEAKLREKNGC